LNYWKGILLL